MSKTIVITGGSRGIGRATAVLCAQRGPTGNIPHLWEFPGGKIELGETHRLALQREIVEELGCTIDVGAQITTTTHSYDFAEITITTYYCHLTSGNPRAKEHEQISWLPPNQLHTLNWAPADIPTVALIQDQLTS